MKIAFVLLDKASDFTHQSMILNRSILDHTLSALKRSGLDRIYLVSDKDLSLDITTIDSKAIKDYIEEDSKLLFIDSSFALIRPRAIKRSFRQLESYDLIKLHKKKANQFCLLRSSILMESGHHASIDNLLEEINKLENLKEINQQILKSNKKDYLQVTDLKSQQKALSILQKRINYKWLKKGVFIEAPEESYIDASVTIGKGTTIEAGCRLLGQTSIGEHCHIGYQTKIVDSKIGNNVTIEISHISQAVIDAYVTIGPFARIRPNSHLKERVHIGNFVEVKNASLGKNTKAGHLAYIGDADLGEDINIGCGVVFVNYDGKFKYRSTIDDRAFIGSNANIVAPVHVKSEAWVAAGSTISKDVDPGNLAIERGKRKDILGYAERKKQRDLLKEKQKEK